MTRLVSSDESIKYNGFSSILADKFEDYTGGIGEPTFGTFPTRVVGIGKRCSPALSTSANKMLFGYSPSHPTRR